MERGDARVPCCSMATTDPALQPAASTTGRTINEFSIQVATVNGSGSQTANLILIRSLFQMGIPVSGKNLFPSNIAGLPTWYTIRANKHGYIARKKEIDFLVAMNVETAREDVLTLEPGARRGLRRAVEPEGASGRTWRFIRCRLTSWSRRCVPMPSCAVWCAT